MDIEKVKAEFKSIGLKLVKNEGLATVLNQAGDGFPFLIGLPNNRKSGKVEYHLPQWEDIPPCDIRVADVCFNFRQLLLEVTEQAREFEQRVNVWHKNKKRPPPKDCIRKCLPITVPKETEVKVLEHQAEEDVYGNETYHKMKVSCKVLNPTKTYFLIGWDEKHTFISMLSGPAKTVQEAHENLKPPEVKKAEREGRTVLRQGEYYFIQPSKQELKAAQVIFKRNFGWVSGNTPLDDAHGEESDHNASMIVYGRYKNKEYAFAAGLISNRRHKALFLPSIMKVVLNTEQPSQDNTWD